MEQVTPAKQAAERSAHTLPVATRRTRQARDRWQIWAAVVVHPPNLSGSTQSDADGRTAASKVSADASRVIDRCADAASSLHCLPWRICCCLAMYITDLTHFLDKSGAIGPVKGPARTMAQFHVEAVAHASDGTSEALPAPKCFKCGRAGPRFSLHRQRAGSLDLRRRRGDKPRGSR